MKRLCPLGASNKHSKKGLQDSVPFVEERNGLFEDELRYGAEAISASAGRFIDHSITRLKERVGLNRDEEALARKTLSKEIAKGIKEFFEVPSIIKKGERDIVEGKRSIEGLIYVYFITSMKELGRIGISRKCATTLALMSVAPETKLYTLPGHQLRVAEIMHYIKEKIIDIDFRFPWLMAVHDFGKVAFNSGNLRGGSKLEKITGKYEQRGRGEETINAGIRVLIAEGHACFCHELMEKMKKECLNSRNHKEIESAFRKVLDHHLYTNYGVDPKVKAMALLADYLDGVMSYREYVAKELGSIEKARARVENAFLIDNQYMEFGKKAGYSKPEVSNLIFGFVEKTYGRYMKELFGELCWTSPKLDQEAMARAEHELEIFSSLGGIKDYLKVMVDYYLAASKTERRYIAYGIGHMLREARERLP